MAFTGLFPFIHLYIYTYIYIYAAPFSLPPFCLILGVENQQYLWEGTIEPSSFFSASSFRQGGVRQFGAGGIWRLLLDLFFFTSYFFFFFFVLVLGCIYPGDKHRFCQEMYLYVYSLNIGKVIGQWDDEGAAVRDSYTLKN